MKRTKKDISHVIAHEYCGIKWAYVVFFHDGNILYPVKYMHMNCHREYTKLPKYIKEFIQDAELASVRHTLTALRSSRDTQERRRHEQNIFYPGRRP